jgi:hypothetical protein
VVSPSATPTSRWEHLLHLTTRLQLKVALLFRPGVSVAEVSHQPHGSSADVGKSDQ